MRGWRKTAVTAANRILQPTRLRLTHEAVLEACSGGVGKPAETFRFAGRDYPYFIHHHNCGFPGAFATERTVELALADAWLRRAPKGKVIEVGAVTPYYWPGRVARVVDPADEHEQVTDRCVMGDVDLTGAWVLCVSTLEHFGHGDYGLPKDPAVFRAAVEQFAKQPAAFLITIPIGLNPVADEWVFGTARPAGAAVRFLVRDVIRLGWREVTAAEAKAPYGPVANAVAVIERGGELIQSGS
jgi:hypothetical protein